MNNLTNIVFNRLYCLWASFRIYNLNIEESVPITKFPKSWLSDQVFLMKYLIKSAKKTVFAK